MWEGVDRFMKTVELTGDYCTTLKDYKNSSEKNFKEAFRDIRTKLDKTMFNESMKELKEKLKIKRKTDAYTNSDSIKEVHKKIDENYEKILKKFE
jgi:hypothetical protein